MKKIPNPELMTVKDVATHFGCGVSTVWRWHQNGVLPKAIRIGGLTRWRRAEIEALTNHEAA